MNTRKELAAAYNVSVKTFSKWIHGLGFYRVRFFSTKQLQAIYELLGKP